MKPDADSLASFCYNFFDNLPKTGKPKDSEWTVFCCIVKTGQNDKEFEMVSLGIGSKCIGQDKMSGKGDVLNDSHAEIMARRGFLRYLYDQIHKHFTNEESIFTRDIKGLKLMSDCFFHMFCTQSPCGDISNIRNHDVDETNKTDNPKTDNKINKSLSYHEVIKRRKLDEGSLTNITGAKAIIKSCDDEDIGLGQPCTKPGKGVPTLSMSCSDKLAKWTHIGVQGALLSLLLKDSIHFSSITIGGGSQFSKESFYRGLIDRKYVGKCETEWEDLHSSSDAPIPVVPFVQQSDMIFKHDKAEHLKPCASSIVWCKVDKEPMQVAVNGRKLGVTKKNLNILSSSLLISKYHLYKTFMSTVKYYPHLKDIPINSTYKSVKERSVDYNKKFTDLKANFFGVWTEKPDLNNFVLDIQ